MLANIGPVTLGVSGPVEEHWMPYMTTKKLNSQLLAVLKPFAGWIGQLHSFQ